MAPPRASSACASAPVAALFALAVALSAAAPAGHARDLFVDSSARNLAASLGSVVVLRPEWPPDAARTEEPEASGVVWSDGRHIVTAHHVVAKARSLRVETQDGRILAARLTGFDAATDLALIAVDSDLPPARLAAEPPGPGEKVCAAGNAFGLGVSLTCGIVSAVGRSGVGFNTIEDFVQTDAAVNPGQSGGALFNRDGELVGVLSAIFTKRSDANIGVNFAVSLALARRIVEDLLDDGRVARRDPGVRFAANERSVRSGPGQLRAPRVAGVTTGSPAERAGLVIGDRIVAAGGRRTKTDADFRAAVDLAAPAGRLPLTLMRAGEEIATVLEFETPPAN